MEEQNRYSSRNRQQRELLQQIYEGMSVVDSEGEEVGEVDYVYLGEVDAESDEGPTPATPSPAQMPGEGSWLDMLAEVFAAGDEIPDVVVKRLLRSGFIRVEGEGLFGARRYITPEQIATIGDEEVHLLVSEDDLYEEGD